ncbi:MAG: cobalamin-binding protein [Chloroflexi bacterium]|nr:cobalamin-binding protein [Chloroflexota bacterium]
MQQNIILDDAEQAEALARQALTQGVDSLEAINQRYVPGVNYAGDQFGCGEIFLPDLVLAGEALKAAAAVLEPNMQKSGRQRQMLGKVVLGTVRGDVHEIDKTLVVTMLSSSGFEVHDLGVDVPYEKFVEKAREVDADIVGLLPQVKVMVGGAPVTRNWADKIGAKGYSADALAAVTEAKRLVGVS